MVTVCTLYIFPLFPFHLVCVFESKLCLLYVQDSCILIFIQCVNPDFLVGVFNMFISNAVNDMFGFMCVALVFIYLFFLLYFLTFYLILEYS